MSLIDVFMTACVLMIRSGTDDGEGGQTTAWTESTQFSAAIVLLSDREPQEAQREVSRAAYTVTVPVGVQLRHHDVFKRLSDNKIFRVTSGTEDDRQTPACASFSFAQVQAEEWELT